ncbi:MAG: hypothetical protein WCG92_20770 [Hyphomicrobiales bacterium]|nr:hypothetical protein [Alphaproteobacteria bacterium]
MPFRDIKQFDSDTLRGMSQAFDAACDRLKLDPDNPQRGDLAFKIIELASEGERDPAKLFAFAVEVLDN